MERPARPGSAVRGHDNAGLKCSINKRLCRQGEPVNQIMKKNPDEKAEEK